MQFLGHSRGKEPQRNAFKTFDIPVQHGHVHTVLWHSSMHVDETSLKWKLLFDVLAAKQKKEHLCMWSLA